MLNILPSVSVCRDVPSSAVPKICLRNSDKKLAKSVESSLLNTIAYFKRFILVYIILYSTSHAVIKRLNKTFQFWAQPMLLRILKRVRIQLFSWSNAFVRSMKEIYNGIFCSMNFYFCWWPEQNPHCDSGYTRSASCCSRTSIKSAKILPTMHKIKMFGSYCSQFVPIYFRIE